MRILYFTADSQYAEPAKDGSQSGSMKEYARLDLWPELERVTDTLFDARAEGRVELTVVPEASRGDIHRYLNELPVDVVHFSGHGDKVNEQGEHHLVLMDENHEGLFGEYTPNEWIREQLKGKEVKLLVLNCCWSAGVAKALDGAAQCIIGTEFEVRSDRAAQFSEFLYRELERGLTIRQIRKLIEDREDFKNYRFKVSDDKALDLALQPVPPEERRVSPPRVVLEKRKEVELLYASHQFLFRADLLKLVFAIAVAAGGYVLFGGDAPVEVDAAIGTLSKALGFEHPDIADFRCTVQGFVNWVPEAISSVVTGIAGYVISAVGYAFRWLLWLRESISSEVLGWSCAGGDACVPEGPLQTIQFLVAKAPWLKWEPGAIVTALYANPLGRMLAFLHVKLGVAATLAALKALSLKTPAAVERYLATGRIDAMIHWLKECQK